MDNKKRWNLSGDWFFFSSFGLADYNCKCYYKPNLTPSKWKWIGEMGKLSRWCPRGAYTIVLWMVLKNSSEPRLSTINWHAVLNHRCCHHLRYLLPSRFLPPVICIITAILDSPILRSEIQDLLNWYTYPKKIHPYKHHFKIFKGRRNPPKNKNFISQKSLRSDLQSYNLLCSKYFL